MFGGHVRAVFSLITVIFVVCVGATVTSCREIPLYQLAQEGIPAQRNRRHTISKEAECGGNASLLGPDAATATYGALEQAQMQTTEFQGNEDEEMIGVPEEVRNKPRSCSDGYVNYGFEELEPNATSEVSLRQYLLSIVHMPKSLRILCATNFFCWSAHVCYSLYFTDFVGEAVFGGDPQHPEGSVERDLYEEGVRFGCWGMAMYSLSCACYSLVIDHLVQRFRAKSVYVGGQLVYCTGMSLLALTRHRAGVLIFSWTAGVMYSTLFTMPYLLVAHYHAQHTFSASEHSASHHQVRGLGTDVALVSSMVFLAQLTLSAFMGTIVSWAGTTTAVVCVAAVLSFCGAMCATQVLYLDL
ncbi:hypothetical protein B566_EDAN001031 [Ephemera danica]|nr:hypothetical protein B566_EDAN001031 [Ephemera danica]